jgi:hypothetical protein
MAGKYDKIRRTPTFIAAFSELRTHLREKSPVAYLALPSAMATILDIIEKHPRAWPVKRKMLGGNQHEFHLAIMDLAYRRIHVRYNVDDNGICYLLTAWIDGQDEPSYIIPNH